MQPKHGIGDEVYILYDTKVTKETVLGVIAIFEDDRRRYETKKTPKFREFRYFFEPRRSIETYGWTSEAHIFPSKEALIASL